MKLLQAISASCRRRKAGATYLLTAVLIALPIIGTVLSSAGAATASKVIAAQLLDATDDPSMAGMQLTIDQDTLPAGPITFAVTNQSKSVVHELLVVKLPSEDTKLPYDEKNGKVVESKLNKVVDTERTPRRSSIRRPRSYSLARARERGLRPLTVALYSLRINPVGKASPYKLSRSARSSGTKCLTRSTLTCGIPHFCNLSAI
jgi:hypothetical protein